VLVWYDGVATRWRIQDDKPAFYTNTATWDPVNMANSAMVSTSVTVTGIAAGDVCSASHDQLGANNVMVSAHPSSPNTVRVVLENGEAGAVDIASGTVRVICWKAP
jgi:hypothetical protein